MDKKSGKQLTEEQKRVTQERGTERPFTGALLDNKEPGLYRCVVCEHPLFTSDTKYDSGSGWPSFWDQASNDAVVIKGDNSLGMTREEAVCANCDAHLGHRFPDGPGPTGQRYCINSASLDFEKRENNNENKK